MKNKTIISLLIIITVIALVLIKVSYDAGVKKGIERTTPKTSIELAWAKLLKSNTIDISAITNGTVKEISNRNLILVRKTEQGEGETFSVAIQEGAKIFIKYILPEGAKIEEIKGNIKFPNGRVVNLGEKEIKLEDIQIGDDVFINLELLADGSYQGNSIVVTPANLLEGE